MIEPEKFLRRPLEVEAMQLTPDGGWDAVFAWLAREGWRAQMRTSTTTPEEDAFEVEDTDGYWVRAYSGDWIVKFDERFTVMKDVDFRAGHRVP